jgi:hypothetical protein
VTAHPNFSPYWPNPMHVVAEGLHPRNEPCERCEALDCLGQFRLIPYQRTDNGECGRWRDPYGCLGESQEFQRVFGIGFRQPGEPLIRGQ